jgi:hypothetical protein
MKKIQFLFLLMMASFGVFAQPQFFNGNTGTSANGFPFNSTTSNKVQWIYGPGIFDDNGTVIGGTPAYNGLITHVFVRLSTAPTAVYTNFTIQMSQNVGTATTWATGTFTTGMTTVFGPTTHSFSPAVGGWYQIALTTPFLYDPSLSLAVEMAQSAYTGAGASIFQTSVGGNQRIFGAFASPTGTAGTGWADMGINMIPSGPCSVPPTAGTSTTTPATTTCFGSNVLLNLTGNSQGTGQTYQWESSANLAGPYTTVGASGPSAALNTTATGTLYYRCAVTCSGNTQYSTPVLLTVPAPFPAGTYTINSALPTGGTNYQTFAAAISAISCGIAGPIVFDVVPGSGPYNEQVLIPQVFGASATNTVTFNGNGTTLSFAATTTTNPSVLELDGADHIKVNDLNIISSATSSAFAVHLWNGANFNRFSNCVMSCNITATISTTSPFSVSGSKTAAVTSGLSGDNDSLVNCTLNGGYYGAAFTGPTTAPFPSGNFISGCTINDCYFYSVYAANNQGIVIDNNLVQRPTRTSFTTSYGIFTTTNANSSKITRNRIRDFFTSTPSNTSAFYGIYVTGSNSTLGDETKIVNNIINNNNNEGANYGIYVLTVNNIHVYHNTISMDNTAPSVSTALTRGIWMSNTAPVNSEIRNNIVSISRANAGAKHCLYYAGAAQVSNHNVLFISSASGINNIGFFGSDVPTFAGWQATNANSWDQQSVNVDPVFNAPTSPTFDFTPTVSTVNNIGVPVGVTNDINNAVRSVSNPDPGAIEFTISATDIALVNLISPNTGGCYSVNEPVVVTIQNTGITPLDLSVNPVTFSGNIAGVITVPLSGVLNTGTLAVNATTTFTLTPNVNMTAVGTYTINVSASVTGDGNPANDNLSPAAVRTVLASSGGTISTPSVTYCASGAPLFTLIGASGGTRQWQQSTVSASGPWTNVGSNGLTYTPSPALTQNTFVQCVTTCNLVVNTSNVLTITVNPAPLLSVTPSSASFCIPGGTPIPLAATTGLNSYSWAPTTGLSATNISNPIATPTGTTTYTVTGTDGIGCTATATSVITVNTNPQGVTATATPNILCIGDVANLTSTGSISGVVNVGTGTSTISGSNGNPYRSGNGTGNQIKSQIIYTATELSAAGMSPGPITGLGFTCTSATGTVINFSINIGHTLVNTLTTTFETSPMAQVFTQASLTPVIGVNLHTFNSGSFIWDGTSNILVQTCQTNSLIGTTAVSTYTPASTQSISQQTSPTACSNPIATIVATKPIIRFTQNIPVSYTWSLPGDVVNPTSQNTATTPVSGATTYTVTASNAGCNVTATTSITLKPTITGTAIATPSSICIGSNTTLSGNIPPICGGSENTFAGTYAPVNWVLSQDNSNGLVNTAGAPSSIILTSGTNQNVNGLGGTTSYRIIVPCSGNVSFNWAFSTLDIAFSDRPRYQVNSGLSTDMPGFNIFGSTSQSGTANIPVNQGDTLYLQAWTLDNDQFAGTMTFSNFSAPAAPISGFVNFWDAPTGGNLIGGSPTTVAPIASTTYYAQFNTINPQGCTNPVRLAIPVSVNAYPTVTANSSPSPATVCTGTSVTLTGGGATTYSWTDGVNTPTDGTAFNPTSTSTYTVTGTTAGCSSTATITVNVSSGTAPTAIGDTICGPGLVNLSATATPGDTLFWYTAPSGGSPVAQGTSFNPTVSADSTFYVEGNAVLGSSTQSFLTGMLNNTAGGGQQSSTNFNIFDVLAPSITLDSVTIYPGSTGPQTVNIQLANSSSVVLQTILVAINPTVIGDPLRIPVGMVIPAGTGYQLGQSASSISLFRNSSGVTYPYTIPGVVSITNSAAGSTFYYFFYNWRVTTGSTTYCPSATRTPVLAKVNPLPVMTTSATPSSICIGGSSLLSATGADTYTWMPGTLSGTSVNVTPAVTTTYTVTGTLSATGCISTNVVTVTLNPSPTFTSASATPTLVCANDLTSLTANATVITGGTGPGAYAIASIPHSPETPAGPTTAGPTGDDNVSGAISLPFPFTFYGVVKNNIYISTNGFVSFDAGVGSGCCSGQIIPDVNAPNDLISFAWEDLNIAAGQIDYFTNGTAPNRKFVIRYTNAVWFGGGSTVLNGQIILNENDQSIEIHGTSGGPDAFNNTTAGIENSTGTLATAVPGKNSTSPWTWANEGWRFTQQVITPITNYAWSDPIAGVIASPTLQTTNANPTSSYTYTVTATSALGCTATSTVQVNVNPLPVVTATPSIQTVCQNASATISGGGATSYAWTGGISDATPFTVTSSATYTVTGTGANGCTNTATAVVNMNAAPAVTAGATPTTTCNNTVVTPTGSGASTYTWTGGLTDNTPFIATATATYTVTGTDGIGCSATSSVTVTVTPASGTLAPATSNQSQTHNDDFNVNYSDASCNLIATVDDGAGGNILGLTTATVNVEATAGVHNGQPFVRRWYQITPTSNGSADVILYINQADFNDYNAAVTAPYLPLPTSGNNADPNIANIRITKNSDAGLGNSPVVITPTVNWNGTYWELSFNTPSFSQFRVHSVNPGNIPLPATVTNFSGRKMSTSDMLEWTTASEQNNAYFNLQHGTDGINFTTIAKVNSQAINGNSSSILNYSFENTKPQLGHNYYRLQQVDIDNHSTMNAKVVDIIWGTNGSTVSIYPNPTQDVLNIDLYTTKVQNTTVKVLDMSGRIVKQIQGRSEAGMNKLSISLGEIASGVYTVQVFENDNLTHVSKVKKND